MRSRHPNGRLVPLGINVDAIPMGGGGERLAYVARLHPAKGYDIAFDVSGRAGRALDAVGFDHVGAEIPQHVKYHGEIKSNGALFLLLGNAHALLSPSRFDAGGRINLEAAACGTPVLCLDGTGTRDHVSHGVSGWICENADDLLDALQDVPLLNREQAREWVAYTHGFASMLRAIEEHAQSVLDGESW
jgi:glycosyltransferase involved in cell wall biosynthesis